MAAVHKDVSVTAVVCEDAVVVARVKGVPAVTTGMKRGVAVTTMVYEDVVVVVGVKGL